MSALGLPGGRTPLPGSSEPAPRGKRPGAGKAVKGKFTLGEKDLQYRDKKWDEKRNKGEAEKQEMGEGSNSSQEKAAFYIRCGFFQTLPKALCALAMDTKAVSSAPCPVRSLPPVASRGRRARRWSCLEGVIPQPTLALTACIGGPAPYK